METVYLGPPGRNFGDLEEAAAAAVRRALGENPGVNGGDVLCFLPGAGEIRRVVTALQRDQGLGGYRLSVFPLHGGLSQAEGRRVFTPPKVTLRASSRLVSSVVVSSLTTNSSTVKKYVGNSVKPAKSRANA